MDHSAVALGRVDAPLKGVLFVIAGISIFSIQDVIIKSISGSYPVHEIVFVRSVVALAPLLLIAHFDGGLSGLRTRRPLAHLLRACAMLASYTTFYLAIVALPLASAVALFFVAPLLITALSHFVLGEKAQLRRWLAVATGFIGVLIMTQPDGSTIEPAALFAVCAALFYALSVMATRSMGATESGASLAFSATLFYVGANGLLGLWLGDGSLAKGGHPSLEHPVPGRLLLATAQIRLRPLWHPHRRALDDHVMLRHRRLQIAVQAAIADHRVRVRAQIRG